MATFLEAGLKPGMLALAVGTHRVNHDDYQNVDVSIGSPSLDLGYLDGMIIRAGEIDTNGNPNWEDLAFGTEDPNERHKKVIGLLNLGLKPDKNFRRFYRPDINDRKLEAELEKAGIEISWKMEEGVEIYIAMARLGNPPILEYSPQNEN